MSHDIGPVMQHGYVVDDVEKAAIAWGERMGVGPFYVFERAVTDQTYRGRRMDIELKLGLGYWGDIQIELVQQLNDVQTLYNSVPRKSAEHLHHFGTYMPDIDSVIAHRKLESSVIQSGTMADTKFVYLENYAPLGMHMELIQAPQSGLMAFEGMKAISRIWDGKKPVRSRLDLATDLAALKNAG